MAGISSKAMAFGDPANKRNKFQTQELNDDLGMDVYQFKYRMDDYQTGRFWQVEPLSDKYVYNSNYAFSEDKVTNHIELEGLETLSAGSPQGYLVEGFRELFQGWGNALSGSAETHSNHELEVTSQIKTPEGTISTTTSTTISENKFEIKFNLGDFLGNRAKSLFEINSKNSFLSKVENKTSVSILTEGAPIKMSTKTTIDENGKSQTFSVGTGANIETPKGGLDISAVAFYKQQLSGDNVGQTTFGLRLAVDASYVHHSYITTVDKNVRVKTTVKSNVGASLQLNIITN